MFRLMFVFLGLFLSACQPTSVKITDLDSFDDESKRDGLVHGTLKTLPPSDHDNAKITVGTDSVTLTKAHVLGIKSELYQPSFRLEGVISPLHQTDVALAQTASLETLYVKIGDVVDVGDKLALFYHNTVINNNPRPKHTHTDNDTHHSNHADSDDDTNDDDSDDDVTSRQSHSLITQEPILVYATQQGRVHRIYPQNQGQTYPKGTPVVAINDESQLKFTSMLPDDFKNHLNIGSAVVFSTANGKTFSGQIEKATPDTIVKNTLNVHVVIRPSEIQKAQLTLGERVSGYVDYGQKSVGVLVPDFAIFDENFQPMDLSHLEHPPFKPITPIDAYIWVIKQDERLYLSPIEIIEYQPQSDHFLINGVSLTGLIVLAQLPKTAQGKKVRLK